MKEEQIIKLLDKQQVAIVNSYTYGKLPMHLARNYSKVIVATSETFIYHKFKLVSKKFKDVIYLSSAVSHLQKQYHIAFMSYGTSILIREIWNNKDKEDAVLVIDDSINCVNADVLISFVRHLMMKGAKLKLVIINKVEKHSKKLSSVFNAPIVNCLPKNNIKCEFHSASELEDRIMHFYYELSYQNILVILPGDREIQHMKKSLAMHLPNDSFIYTISSGFMNCKYLTSIHKKIVLATGNVEAFLPLIGFKFDVVIDSGLERKWKVINDIETLVTRHISKNSIEQRKALGNSYCLCSDYEYKLRKEVDIVLEASLDKMLLSIINLGMDVASFPLLFPNSIYCTHCLLHLLYMLNCIDENDNITALGKEVLTLSLSVRFAKMFLEAIPYHLEGDALILYYICYNSINMDNFEPYMDLKSDLFTLLYEIKQLYLNDISKFRQKFPRLKKTFEWFSTRPSQITNIPVMKKLLASAFPDCLFILTSKTGYKCQANSKFSYTTLRTSSLVRGENNYIVGFLPSINRSKQNRAGIPQKRGFILMPTAYTYEEVLECFEPFLDNKQYNGILI